MKHTKVYIDFQKCVESEIANWQKTKLTTIEQTTFYYPVLSGIVRAAMYILKTEEYLEFTKWIRDNWGGCF